MSGSRVGPPSANPLVLGMGWFPDQPGGLNRYVRELLSALRSESLHVRAVVLGPASDPPDDVRVAASADESLPLRLWAFMRAARTEAASADVVDAHFALNSLLCVLGPLRRKPLVVHFHGPWALESEATGDSRLKARLKKSIERSVYRRARAAICLSHAFKRVLVEQYGVAPWLVSVVPPGVDLDRFAPGSRLEARSRLGVDPDCWLAFTVRRLVPRMGLHVLLEAWARVQAGNHASLVIAGEGPERRRLESLAAELGVVGSVRFVGEVGDEELADWYRAADLFVLPSTALEGFGLVTLEALASGTPAIATDVSGAAETLSRLDPRLVVAAGDARALGDCVEGARSGAVDLPAPEACRAFAEKFSWRAVATHHRRIYERASQGSRPGAMRVVYLDHCAQLSGGELALLELLPHLPVEAHVILGEDGPLVARLVEAGISVEVLPLASSAREVRRHDVGARLLYAAAPAHVALYAARLTRRLRRLRPDLVVTNSLKSALYGAPAARLAGMPAVWHVRDRIAEDYLSPAGVRLVRLAARTLPSAVIANSRATLATLGDGLPPAVIVPSPVQSFEGSHRRSTGTGLVVGIVGRIAPWKGQDVFLTAFARAFPDADATRAVVVGAALFGEHSYESELRRRAEALGLNGRVEFTGFRSDIGAVLAELDVIVHASVLPEPFGRVVVEGMSAGLPVVAAAAGGLLEIIDDGVTGLLYPPGDVEALAAALRRLAADENFRDRLGNAARRRAESFTAEAIAPRELEVYRSVVRGHSGSPSS